MFEEDIGEYAIKAVNNLGIAQTSAQVSKELNTNQNIGKNLIVLFL